MDNLEIEEKVEEILDKISPYGMSQTKKEEILAEIESILSVDPNNTDVLQLKAMVYQFTDDFENAITTYKKILEINPGEKDVEDNIKSCEQFMEWKLKKNNSASEYRQDSSGILNMELNISVWHILILKIIVLAIVIYLFLMPLFS